MGRKPSTCIGLSLANQCPACRAPSTQKCWISLQKWTADGGGAEKPSSSVTNAPLNALPDHAPEVPPCKRKSCAPNRFQPDMFWSRPNRDAVNRRIPGCNRLGDVGIKKLHFFESVGRPGFVGIRERSCHKCAHACVVGLFEKCSHNDRCGAYRILELSPKTTVPRASTRLFRENGALAFAEDAKVGDFFATDWTMESAEKFTVFSIAKDNFFREAEECIQATATTMPVQKGEFVIDGIRHSCVSAGGTVFSPTALEVVVPVRAILAFNLTFEYIVPRRIMRESVGNIEKWQMSSEDHARVLRLQSETLDDQVAHAVETVSGRS